MNTQLIGDALSIILALVCLGCIGYMLFVPGQTPEMTRASDDVSYFGGPVHLDVWSVQADTIIGWRWGHRT